MRGQLQSIAYATFFLSVAAVSMQSYAADVAAEEGLCTPRLRVDKEKLSAYLLKKYPVSTAYLAVGAHPTPLQSNQQLLHWLLAKRAAQHAGGKCDSSDTCSVDHIASAIQDMLDGKDSQLTPQAKTDPVRYLVSANTTFPVFCAAADAKPALPDLVPATATLSTAAPAAAPAVASASAAVPGSAAAADAKPSATPNSWLNKLRIRGNPDQLAIDRSDTAGYASVDKATIDFSNDAVASTRTSDVTAYGGFSWIKSSLDDNGSTYEAVPYVGYKQSTVVVNAAGATTVTTLRNTDVGLLSSFHFAHPDSANTEDFSARPDYLIDNENGSKLLSANFTYTVIRKGWLNDLIKTPYGASVKPILIAESRNGTYIDRGDATVSDSHQDFLRLGAQVGFAVISDNPKIPIDFTATYTGLAAIVGSQGIHYVKAGLTYNFNQNLGLVMNYSNGILPETGDREKKWNLGVASKF